jgi:hypothetical protein
LQPAIIAEIAAGFDFYWDTFQHPDFKLLPVIEYVLKDS